MNMRITVMAAFVFALGTATAAVLSTDQSTGHAAAIELAAQAPREVANATPALAATQRFDSAPYTSVLARPL